MKTERSRRMKTEAIEQCIDWSAGSPRMKIKATEQLTAIETALAAKDEALSKLIEMNRRDELTDPDRIFTEHGREMARNEAEAALSPSTGKVLIDIEKIREIHNELIIEAEGDATVGIVGLEERSELCALIDWLGNLLKERG